MLDLIAHHALPLTQHRHILFRARNIQLQLIKSDRQSLMAKVRILWHFAHSSAAYAMPTAKRTVRRWRKPRKSVCGWAVRTANPPTADPPHGEYGQYRPVGRSPAAAQRGLGKILYPTLILMIGKAPMDVHLIAGAVCQIGPHGRDRINLPRRNIPFHQRAGNHRPHLLFIVAITIFLIEFVDRRKAARISRQPKLPDEPQHQKWI